MKSVDWPASASNTGGRVRDYRIDPREAVCGRMFSEWHEITNTFDKEITLRDQPSGTQLEYPVVAQNIAGENPSRPVNVVL